MVIMYGSISALHPTAFTVIFIFAISFAVLGLYLGTLMATSSVDREELKRKLAFGTLTSLALCLLLFFIAAKVFKIESTAATFITILMVFAIAILYFGFVLVYVVLPGHVQYAEYYIWGVIRLYLHIALIVCNAMNMAYKKC